MLEYIVHIDGQQIEIPYRAEITYMLVAHNFANVYQRARSHNGYEREKAIRELLQAKPSPKSAAYLFASVADYVSEISTLPTLAKDPAMLELFEKIITQNTSLVNHLKSVCASYWDAYHRQKYQRYTDYPPCRLINELASAAGNKKSS